jgi:hypothetical protein
MRGSGSVRILLGTVVLAGCGGLSAGCGATTAQAAGVAAAAANTASSTARLADTATIRTHGMSISFTQTGVFDFARSRGVLHMNGPGPMASEELFIPPMVYVKLPGDPSGQAPGGKPWIGFKARDKAGPGASFLGPMGGNVNPADLLSSLRAVSKRVKNLGSAVVRGVQVTHYRVAVDPARAASLAPHSERAGMRAFARHVRVGPVDVWVDEQNLVRRLRTSLSFHAAPGPHFGSGGRFVQTLDFFDFGVPVNVSAPPADKVTNISQLAKLHGHKWGSKGGGFFSSGDRARPPHESGTLAPGEASAVGRVARAFWTALGHHDMHAAQQAILPAQRGCFRALMGPGPRIKVTSLQIVAVRPAGSQDATVLYNIRASDDGHSIWALHHRPGHPLWLVATQANGHWFVNVARSASLGFASACP